jgi:hypothetical protein
MTLNEIKKILEVTCSQDSSIVFLIRGESGIGKTEMVQDLAVSLNRNLLYFCGSTLKEGELGGLPYPDKGVNKYTTHHKIAQLKEHPNSILFFDELNRSAREVQQEIMTLLKEREINGVAVPPEAVMIAAINPNSGDYAVNDMNRAIISRLTILDLDPSVKEWITYGERAGYSEYILSFIEGNPECFLEGFSSPEDSLLQRACPRNWTNLEKLVKIFGPSLSLEMVVGTVGAVSGASFFDFLENSAQVPSAEKWVAMNNEQKKELIKSYCEVTSNNKQTTSLSKMLLLGSRLLAEAASTIKKNETFFTGCLEFIILCDEFKRPEVTTSILSKMLHGYNYLYIHMCNIISTKSNPNNTIYKLVDKIMENYSDMMAKIEKLV